MERLFNHQTIDEFLLDITETAEYKRIEYLIFLIRMNYLHYMAISHILHGMYYPEGDCFTHIDCTKNQYEMSEYIKKYSECEPDIPVDLHTKSNELHYKIWCIENGRYTREVWYNLMTASLNEKYRTLLDEILA